MKISLSETYKPFLLMALFFYMNIIGFLSSFLRDSGKGSFEAIAAGNPVNQVAGLTLLTIGLLIIVRSPYFSVKTIMSQSWPFLLVFVFIFLSISWSEVPIVSFRRLVAFFSLVLTCFVLSQIFTPLSLLESIYRVSLIVIILGFVWTILQGHSITIGIGDQKLGMKGIISDKNSAARLYAYSLLLAIGLKKYYTKKGLFSIFTICLALATVHSASAIVIAVSGTALIYLVRTLKQHNSGANLLTLMVMFTTILVSAYIISLVYNLLLEFLGRDPNLTNRAVIWELLTPFVYEKLTYGYGFGAFWASSSVEWFVNRWGFIGNAHSGYIEVLLHGGLVFFTLFSIVIIKFFYNCIKLFVKSKSDGTEPVFIAILIVQLIANYVAYIIFNHSSYDMFLFTLVYFIVAKMNYEN